MIEIIKNTTDINFGKKQINSSDLILLLSNKTILTENDEDLSLEKITTIQEVQRSRPGEAFNFIINDKIKIKCYHYYDCTLVRFSVPKGIKLIEEDNVEIHFREILENRKRILDNQYNSYLKAKEKYDILISKFQKYPELFL